MKKVLFVACLLTLPIMANSENTQKQEGRGENKGFMEQLTEDQKTCIEQQACPKREMKKPEEKSKSGKKSQKKEMTTEEKAAMTEERECQQKAFETCGITMPERPEGTPPSRPEGEDKGTTQQ